MSYMVVMKLKNGVIFASDSYSTYPDKTLKDSCYKKIHCIQPNCLYVGITGMNMVFNNQSQLIDINNTLADFFLSAADDTITDKVNQFAQFLKISCDRLIQDIRIIIAYKKTLYKVDIIHEQNPVIEFYDENQEDIITSGEDIHAVNGILQFEKDDFNLSLNEALEKCIQSVEYEITVERMIRDKEHQIVGGKVQSIIFDYDKIWYNIRVKYIRK